LQGLIGDAGLVREVDGAHLGGHLPLRQR
jgi:hypothetical protein